MKLLDHMTLKSAALIKVGNLCYKNNHIRPNLLLRKESEWCLNLTFKSFSKVFVVLRYHGSTSVDPSYR